MAGFLSSEEELADRRRNVLAKATAVPTIAIDTETNGKDIRDGRGFCIGISIAFKYDNAVETAYYPVAHTTGNISVTEKAMLTAIIHSRTRLIYHNAKFDLASLSTAGIDVFKIPYYCTMLMVHFLNENKPKGLDWLSKNELGMGGKRKNPAWELMSSIYGWSPDFPASVMADYATGDVTDTLLLFEKIYPFFKESGFDG